VLKVSKLSAVIRIDILFFVLYRELYPNKTTAIEKLKAHLVESSEQLAPLKVWELQELSFQAAERIKAAPNDEALNMMAHIAQNFPLQVCNSGFNLNLS
jgi:UDP-glucose:glycoprotein glucosyltransferase